MRHGSRSRICIVGAGPYGVSIAAHLRFVRADFRIFGSPMRRWLTLMPKSMLLKSESCASSLFDPTGHYTLSQHCSDNGITYPEYGTPVSRELFAQYALSFQQRLVPNVEDVAVTDVDRARDGFELRLNNGETLQAEKVIIATGMEYMAYIPRELAQLPTEIRSHTADYSDFGELKGKEVAVVGAGQSALETAAILNEIGVSTSLLVREPEVFWNPVPTLMHRAWYERLRSPRTRFGDGLGLWLYDNAPGLFHYSPQWVRLEKVRTALGPAGAWWLKDRVVGRLPILLGHRIHSAETRSDRVVLRVTDQRERNREIITDHVIAATGYRFNFHKLPFLRESLKHQLRHEDGSPRLSLNFESSIRGLYFTGLGSANSFGPAMRFVAGADYTAQRISRHLAHAQRLPARQFAIPKKCPEF
jgi:cation diffusion facilitator CzcD-associated flavoprotein CzcO